jgi:peptidoglycan/xylan/chitin deacetylase (PgdA/CDA1 family)
VAVSPLDHAIGFWKPLMDPQQLRALARYRDPGQPPVPGINAVRASSDARSYRVVHAGTEFSLFAAVHPIEDVPESAEVVADILGPSGNHYSYVLWFPKADAFVVPFDPNAAVKAFWHEEYVPPANRTALPKPVLAAYYAVKPLLPGRVKQGMRRSMARRALASERALEWPTDESLDLLQRFLLRLILVASGRENLRFAWFWPERRTWAVVLTHDVESAEGLANVPHVVEMERARGLRSSFNLVPRDYEAPGSLLEDLSEKGFEVGVHGYTHDGLLFSKWSTFEQRVAVINEYGRRWRASGFRSPATYRNLDWFHMLEFEYDSSVSNSAPCEPQPGGCCSFFPYSVGGLIEVPITLPQDHTLFELLEQTDATTWLTCLEHIKDANGMACVLAHPDPGGGYIGSAQNEPHYARLLDAVAASEAWTPLPRDLARWWRARALARPTEIGDIEGISFGTAILDPSGRLEIVPPSDGGRR